MKKKKTDQIDEITKILKENFHLFEDWKGFFSTPENMKSWLTEEIGELLVAMHHYYRGRVKKEAVAEELIDVMLCSINLALEIAPYNFAAMLKRKFAKAKKRMKSKTPKQQKEFLDKALKVGKPNTDFLKHLGRSPNIMLLSKKKGGKPVGLD